MSGEAQTCNNEAAISCHKLKAAPVLAGREGLADSNRLVDDGFDVLHKSVLVDGAHKALKTLFHAIVVPAIIGFPTSTWERLFMRLSIHGRLELAEYII